MVRGLLASVMVGTLCAVVGTYVVLRGMAFLGDALAHAILPGIAGAYLMQINLFWGALAMGLLTAVGIGYVSRQGEVKEDTAIGVIFAGSLALGVAMLSTAQNYTVDLTHILFGDVLGVSPTDLWLMAGFGILVLLPCSYSTKNCWSSLSTLSWPPPCACPYGPCNTCSWFSSP